MDNVSKEKRSNTMKAVKSKNTKIEKVVSKEIWGRGIRFRKNVKNLEGKPDIAIKKYKIVIFIDSCFWHGCPLHGRIPKSNVEFWNNKIKRNIERDKSINQYYRRKGWNILRIWEHDLNKKKFSQTIDEIEEWIKIIKSKE
ncbi:MULTISPECIES: very short patch repair endonuclease [Bacillus]|nr:very short patch repair endonuclease [Bacillus subtilis]ASZ63382.1 very short patch repair endonuclease [Bacillus subtilis]MCA0102831.1 very short patch repair endonuclease [Bacillus subtilis]MEC0285679.1 very short patch repair endonuclease [Bacillus subtilis]MEC0479593.1 very short patch repair endonuclease [Bacillus subtilis]MEC0522277.1 very short patch repair endonuclease [Bacillus subtilis]